MELQVSRPELLAALVSALRRAGCVCAEISRDRCVVWHVDAADRREAAIELRFFLRAWQREHAPVRVHLG